MLRRLLVLGFLALAVSTVPHQAADSMSGRGCVGRGICHKVAHVCTQQLATDIIAAGTSSYTIKPGVTNLTRVVALAAGGGADNGGFGGAAGGGGAFSEVDNLAVTPGNTLTLSIGVHGPGGAASAGGQAGADGGDTSVSYLGTQILLANGGKGAFNGGPGVGGDAASSIGTIKHSGGAGGNGGEGGGGGGGAGGPNGDGQAGSDGVPNGTVGPPFPGGNGGAGDGGAGGAGGAGSTQNNVDGLPGDSGREFGSAGSGGGGGGGVGGSVQQSNAGGTGSFGAGGGGTGFGAATFPAGRDGTDGFVAVLYSTCGFAPPPPPPQQNTFFVATSGSDSAAGTLAAPFLTFGRCQTAMRNSTTTKTCTVRAGTYNFSTAIDLTGADNDTTWQFFSGDGVNSAVIDGGSATHIATFDGVNNFTWNGIKIQHCGGSCMITPSNPVESGITIENTDIGFDTNSGEVGGFTPVIGLDNVRNSTFKNNYFHDCVSQCLTLLAFNAGDSLDGDVISGNFAERCVTAVNDGGCIYLAMRNSNFSGGHVSVTNNYVRDYGAPGVESHGIYLDDDASNVIVTGNIVGPMSRSGAGGNPSSTIVNGGTANTFSGNLFDLGATSQELVGRGSAPGDGGAVFFNWGTAKNIWQNNIVIANYPGATTTSGGIAYLTSVNYPTANGTIQNNAYHNYGGGAETTTGNVLNDQSPQHLTAGQLGLVCTNGIYSITPGSAVLGAPVSFPALPTRWGPPGFVPPNSTNHSC
jgi:hypothetical protein